MPDGPESGPSGICDRRAPCVTVQVDYIVPSTHERDTPMIGRLRILGIALGVIGLGFVVVGGYAFFKVQEGTSSLKAFSAAQAVELSYNEDGQLVDGGEVAGAESIMALLTEDWGYPVVQGELDPNDPIVNTGSEYMYQMATVSYHTLHGTQTDRPRRGLHRPRRNGVHRRNAVRDPGRWPLLGTVRPREPDRCRGPRTGMDRRGTRPDRRARRRSLDGRGPAARSRHSPPCSAWSAARSS